MLVQRSVWLRYGVAVAAVVLALLLRLALVRLLGGAYPVLTFFPAVVVAAWIGGTGPGILAIALSMLATTFWVLPPLGSLAIHRADNLVGLTFFCLSGLLVVWLGQMRADAARRADDSAASLRESQVQLQAAYEREKRIAETLQRSLLMKPAESQFDGLAVEAFYEAASAEALVGGDFFDAFALSGDKVALVVGDVSGKGLQAASHTAEIKYALRTILREYPHPATALVRLNNVVCESQELEKHDYGRFITICLAVVDPKTGEGNLSTAGSEPPLIIRGLPDSPCTSEPLEDAGGLPLCVESKFSYQVQPFQLDLEDTLLMLTDGITEARRNGTLLGYDGMETLARDAARRATLHDMGQAVLDGARSFAGGHLQDDACLLLARRRA